MVHSAENDLEADNDEETEQDKLNDQLMSLSLEGRVKWHTLLNIDRIKENSKPAESVTKPESTPFFLRTLPGLTPSFVEEASEATGDVKKPAKSAILDAQQLEMLLADSSFVQCLMNCPLDGSFQPFVDLVKSMSPSSIDAELVSLPFDASLSRHIALLHAVAWLLDNRIDFDLAETLLRILLERHGDVLLGSDIPELADTLEKVRKAHCDAWTRLDELIQKSACLMDFVCNFQM